MPRLVINAYLTVGKDECRMHAEDAGLGNVVTALRTEYLGRYSINGKSRPRQMSTFITTFVSFIFDVSSFLSVLLNLLEASRCGIRHVPA